MTDQQFLKKAVTLAHKSVIRGGFPAGALIVNDNKIIATGLSLGFLLHDPTSHAETVCVRRACKNLHTSDLSGATLYASLQPCLMCYSGANWANISRIVYGCRKTADMVAKKYYEGKNDLEKINQQNTHQIKIDFLPNFEEDMLRLLESWEKSL